MVVVAVVVVVAVKATGSVRAKEAKPRARPGQKKKNARIL